MNDKNVHVGKSDPHFDGENETITNDNMGNGQMGIVSENEAGKQKKPLHVTKLNDSTMEEFKRVMDKT